MGSRRKKESLSVSVEDYLAQAEHNQKVADTLAQGASVSLQWAVTCIFYAGLHYVNAYLHYLKGRTPQTHAERDHYVSKQMRLVYKEYRSLKTMSERARYLLFQPTEKDFEASRRKACVIETFVSGKVSRGH